MVRLFLCGTAIVIGALMFAQRPVQAYEAPWCAVVNQGTGNMYWDCQYRSLEACVPNVLAGNRGFCNPNPAYRGVAPQNHRYIRHYRYRQ